MLNMKEVAGSKYDYNILLTQYNGNNLENIKKNTRGINFLMIP